MVVRPDAGVAGERGGKFHDGAGVVGVVIVAGQQRRAGGAAQRGGVKAVVPEAVVRELLKRGHADGSAEGAAMAKADVVDQHDHYIGCALRGLHLEAGRRLRIAGVELVIGFSAGS